MRDFLNTPNVMSSSGLGPNGCADLEPPPTPLRGRTVSGAFHLSRNVKFIDFHLYACQGGTRVISHLMTEEALLHLQCPHLRNQEVCRRVYFRQYTAAIYSQKVYTGQDVFDLPFHIARDQIEQSLRAKMSSIKVEPSPLSRFLE